MLYLSAGPVEVPGEGHLPDAHRRLVGDSRGLDNSDSKSDKPRQIASQERDGNISA